MSGQWATFVQQHAGEDRQHAIAARSGIDQSTISRWLTDRERVPSAPNVVRFARAYGLNVLEALIAAGVITDSEAKMRKPTTNLADVSTSALARELTRRANESAA